MKLLVFLSCLFATKSFAQVIPFTLNEDGNIVVIGKLNDSLQANFVFDTGGGLNVISNKFFQKIKTVAVFEHYYTGFRHDGDRIDFEIYKIPSLSIGSFKMQNILIGVTSLLDQWNMDGVVSLINFVKRPITVDYGQKKLTIESSASMKVIVQSSQPLPIKVHGFDNISLDIFVPVCIQGRILDMELDTGSSPGDILVNSLFMSVLNIDTTKTRNSNLLTPFSGRRIRRYVATIDSVNYCGLKHESLKNVRVDFKQNLIYDGIIGAGYFEKLPFTIDIAAQKIWVKKF